VRAGAAEADRVQVRTRRDWEEDGRESRPGWLFFLIGQGTIGGRGMRKNLAAQ
jgi:hypothetical protein